MQQNLRKIHLNGRYLSQFSHTWNCVCIFETVLFGTSSRLANILMQENEWDRLNDHFKVHLFQIERNKHNRANVCGNECVSFCYIKRENRERVVTHRANAIWLYILDTFYFTQWFLNANRCACVRRMKTTTIHQSRCLPSEHTNIFICMLYSMITLHVWHRRPYAIHIEIFACCSVSNDGITVRLMRIKFIPWNCLHSSESNDICQFLTKWANFLHFINKKTCVRMPHIKLPLCPKQPSCHNNNSLQFQKTEQKKNKIK